MMKRMLKLMMIALLLSIGFYANEAVASTIDALIQKMSAGTTKNAVLDILFFDKTTIWVLVATFFVAVGMVNMASEIGSHFTGASVGNSVGNSAFATISGITVGAASKAIKSGKAYNRYRQAKKDAKGNMSSSALGVNNFVEGSSGGADAGTGGGANAAAAAAAASGLAGLAGGGLGGGSSGGGSSAGPTDSSSDGATPPPTDSSTAEQTSSTSQTNTSADASTPPPASSEDSADEIAPLAGGKPPKGGDVPPQGPGGRAPVNPKVATAAAVAGADKIKTAENKAENAIQEAGEAKERAAQAEERANESTQRIDSVKVGESTPPANGAHNSISDIGSVSVSSANPLARGNISDIGSVSVSSGGSISDIGSVSVSSMDKPK